MLPFYFLEHYPPTNTPLDPNYEISSNQIDYLLANYDLDSMKYIALATSMADYNHKIALVNENIAQKKIELAKTKQYGKVAFTEVITGNFNAKQTLTEKMTENTIVGSIFIILLIILIWTIKRFKTAYKHNEERLQPANDFVHGLAQAIMIPIRWLIKLGKIKRESK